MAKIKLSAIGITNISGKSGGSVFAHNKNGNYVRRLGIPTQPQTAKQTLARSIFGVISRMWGNLTQAQREAWKAYGQENPKTDQFGDSRPLTGRQAFISVNGNLRSADLAPITSPNFDNIAFPTVQQFDGYLYYINDILDEALITADLFGTDAGINYILSVAIVSSGADFGTAKNKYSQIKTGLSSELDGLDIKIYLNQLGVTANNNVYLKLEFVAPNGKKTSPVTALMGKDIQP